MWRKLMAVFPVVFLLVALAMTSCAPGTVSPTPIPSRTPVTGRITFAGSTTLQPLADKLGQAFRSRYPDVTLDIAAGGSVVGIQAIHDGTVDIGMASRALTPAEAQGLTQHPVAVDVIAIVAHAANPVENLTLAQLRDIYLGRITHWRQVGGADRPITVAVREKTSGTRGAFDELVLEKQEPTAPRLKTAVTAGDMAAIVSSDPDAIGYVGFGNLERHLKPLAIDGVLPAEKAARDGSYRLVRPLLFLTGPLTQPLAHLFIDFALGAEGQRIVKESGWVTVQ